MPPLARIVLILFVLLVIGPMVMTYAFGRRFLYYPTQASLEDVQRLGSISGWEFAEVIGTDGNKIRGLFKAPEESAPTLLLFGGNASTLDGNQGLLLAIARGKPWGLAVFSYRGYDASEGSPNQPGILSDAVSITEWLNEMKGVPPDRLVVIGQSLGSGVASQTAHALTKEGTPPKSLVLVSPYTSIAQVFDDVVPIIPVGWLVPDPYRTDKVITKVEAPILLLHGEADTLIAVRHGRSLHELVGERSRYVELPGTGHDIWSHPGAINAIREHTNSLDTANTTDNIIH